MIWPLTLLPRWSGIPRPFDQRFDGQTILITGANSGLGLEAAKKLALAGASTLIITTRDSARGQSAKSAIEAHLNTHNASHTATIIPLILEMSSTESLTTFLTTLKQTTPHLDHAILNAGIVATRHHIYPNTDYESTIQINTISTALLSLHLLPLLRASPLTTQSSAKVRPHLSFVSSAAAWMVNLTKEPILKSSTTPLLDLSQPTNFPSGSQGGESLAAGAGQYGRSKLLLEYLIRRIALLPYVRDADTPSQPAVMVASLDPGPTASDIFRNSAGNGSFLERMFLWAFGLVQKSAAQGANAYVSSLGLGVEGRGEMWMNDEVLGGERLKNVVDQEGEKIGGRVWDEFRAIAEGMDGEGEKEVLRKVLSEA